MDGADSGREEGNEKVFRGAVWDRDSEATPREWGQLAPEFPLPRAVLLSGKSVEQEVDGTSQSPLLGPLAELRKVLWVPVACRGRLLGILLSGARFRNANLYREEMEAVAAELSLALSLEQERLVSQKRLFDLVSVRRGVEELLQKNSPERALGVIVAGCTEIESEGRGLGALFVAIGSCGRGQETTRTRGDVVKFLWRAGDASWHSAVESEPLAGVWRKALETGLTTGSDLKPAWSKTESARVVGIPLRSGNEILGVLVAGFRADAASFANLDRLEFRALAAALALCEAQRHAKDSEKERKSQALLEASREALVVLDGNANVVQRNFAAAALLGEGDKSESNFPFIGWIHARERATAEEWMRKIWERDRGGFPALLQTELRNGKAVQMRIEQPPVGNIAVISLENVESQVETEDKREAAELLSLVEWLDQGVVLYDANDNIRALNLSFAQLTGLAPEETDKTGSLEELISRIAPNSTNPDELQMRWRETARNAECGVREEVQLDLPAPRVVERISRPVWDGNGRKLGRIEIYKDLTAQRIFQARLLQTEKLAALGQMASGVAHELSNPLTSITGYAQRLLMRQDALGRADEVHRIFSEAERAGAILRRMLLSAREGPQEHRPISLNQLIQRTVELQRASLEAEKVRVEMDLDPLLPPVLGDAGQLQQVLMNLIGNARQALESQGSGGTIRLKSEREGTERIRLQVSDSGPGIPEAVQARIFDPFFTTKAEGMGTGLGLSIVLGIVREHEGQVYVKSSPGSGATFAIQLPTAASKGERRRKLKSAAGTPAALCSPLPWPPEEPRFESRRRIRRDVCLWWKTSPPSPNSLRMCSGTKAFRSKSCPMAVSRRIAPLPSNLIW